MSEILQDSDLSRVCKELKKVTDPHSLGLYLGIPESDLKRIEIDHPSVRRRKQEVCSTFLRLNPNASWIVIVQALDEMGEKALSSKIHKKYVEKRKPAKSTTGQIDVSGSSSLSETGLGTSVSESEAFNSPDLRYRCGCKPGCRMHQFCDVGCLKPNKHDVVPVLSETASVATSLHYFHLEAQREHETRQMTATFAGFVDETCKSIRKKVTVVEFALWLMQLQAFCPVSHSSESAPLLLAQQINEICQAGSMERVFLILSNYWSWFNHGLLEEIINKFGDEEDRRRLDDFKESFSTFAQNRIVEFSQHPMTFGAAVGDGQTRVPLLFKVDVSWDSVHINQLAEIHRNLASILEVNPHTLYLASIRKGCILMKFLIPSSVAQAVFPLSASQLKALATADIVLVQCGTYCHRFLPHSKPQDNAADDSPQTDAVTPMMRTPYWSDVHTESAFDSECDDEGSSGDLTSDDNDADSSSEQLSSDDSCSTSGSEEKGSEEECDDEGPSGDLTSDDNDADPSSEQLSSDDSCSTSGSEEKGSEEVERGFQRRTFYFRNTPMMRQRELEQKLTPLKQELASLERELASASQMSMMCQRERASLIMIRELPFAPQTPMMRQRELEQKLTPLKQELSSLERELASASQTPMMRQRELERKLTPLKQELASLERELASASQMSMMRQRELASLERELAFAPLAALAFPEQEFCLDRSDCSDCEENGSEEHRKNMRTPMMHQRELASLERELASLEQELASRKREIASLEQELASRKREIASLEQEVTSLKRELASQKPTLTSNAFFGGVLASGRQAGYIGLDDYYLRMTSCDLMPGDPIHRWRDLPLGQDICTGGFEIVINGKFELLATGRHHGPSELVKTENTHKWNKHCTLLCLLLNICEHLTADQVTPVRGIWRTADRTVKVWLWFLYQEVQECLTDC